MLTLLTWFILLMAITMQNRNRHWFHTKQTSIQKKTLATDLVLKGTQFVLKGISNTAGNPMKNGTLMDHRSTHIVFCCRWGWMCVDAMIIILRGVVNTKASCGGILISAHQLCLSKGQEETISHLPFQIPCVPDVYDTGVGDRGCCVPQQQCHHCESITMEMCFDGMTKSKRPLEAFRAIIHYFDSIEH